MLKDLVLKNRSYRGYDHSVQIPEKDLLELVDLTRYVASSINHQVLKYKIVTDKELVSKIQEQTVWAKALPEIRLPYKGTEPVAFVVICIDHNLTRADVVYLRDVGAVAQTMLLGAVEKGFGGIMIGSFSKTNVKQILDLPDNLEPNLVVAFGKPDEEIVLTDCKDGKTIYYRSPDGKTHYVPKRPLDEIVV